MCLVVFVKVPYTKYDLTWLDSFFWVSYSFSSGTEFWLNILF